MTENPERSIAHWYIISKDASGFEEFAQTAAQAVLDLYDRYKADYSLVTLLPLAGIYISYAKASFAADGRGEEGMIGAGHEDDSYWTIQASDRELTNQELAIIELWSAKARDFPVGSPFSSLPYDETALRQYIANTLKISYEEAQIPELKMTEYKLDQSFIDCTVSMAAQRPKASPTEPPTATATPLTITFGSPYPPVDALSNARPELIGEDWYFDVPADDSGNVIVGFDYNSHCITSYDLVSGMKQELIHLVASRGIVGVPSVYGDKVAYITGQFDFQSISASSLTWPPPSSDFIISVLDMTTGEIKNLTTDNHFKMYPIVYGDTVVWLDARHTEGTVYGQFDLYAYDLKTGSEKRLTSTSSIPNESLVFNGDWVVWKDKRNGGTNNCCDTYAYDLKHNMEKRLTSVSSYGIYNLCGSGNYVVWQDDRNANPESPTKYDYTYNQDIYMYDLARNEELRITSYSGRDHSPAIDGDCIVWIRETGERLGDIFAYDITTGQETRVSHTGNAWYDPPTIKGGLVLWVDSAPRKIIANKVVCDGPPGVAGLYLYDFNTERQISVRLPEQVWDSWRRYSCHPTIINNTNVLYTLGDESGRTWVYAAGVDAGEFAIYAVTHKMAIDEILQTNLDNFDQMEKPIISVDDIVAYHKETHEIELSQSGLARFNSAPGVIAGQPFVVCVGKERIYSGLFWSTAFSMSPPTINILLLHDGAAMGSTLNVSLGGLTNGADPRADARILRSFGHAGKLK